MKKLISVSLMLILILSSFSLAACSKDKGGETSEPASKNTVLTVQDTAAKAGERIAVPVVLKNMDAIAQYGNGKLAGIQFKVKVDTAVLKIVGVETELEDLEDESQWVVDGTKASDGSYMVMATDEQLVGLPSTGEKSVATLYFDVAQGASGSYTVEIELVGICDTEANSDMKSHVEVGSGTVTVE